MADSPNREAARSLPTLRGVEPTAAVTSGSEDSVKQVGCQPYPARVDDSVFIDTPEFSLK
jgi:hypothetical protein